MSVFITSVMPAEPHQAAGTILPISTTPNSPPYPRRTGKRRIRRIDGKGHRMPITCPRSVPGRRRNHQKGRVAVHLHHPYPTILLATLALSNSLKTPKVVSTAIVHASPMPIPRHPMPTGILPQPREISLITSFRGAPKLCAVLETYS